MKLVYLPNLAVNNIGFFTTSALRVPVYVSVKILIFTKFLEQKTTKQKVMRKVLKFCKF